MMYIERKLLKNIKLTRNLIVIDLRYMNHHLICYRKLKSENIHIMMTGKINKSKEENYVVEVILSYY